MRKFLLVTAMVLISASAQAGQSRSLSLASVDDRTAATQAKLADTSAAAQTTPIKSAENTTDAVKCVVQPQGVSTTAAANTTAAASTTATSQPQQTDSAKPVASHAARASRPKHRSGWTEARVIGELHRHGIYW